MYLKIAFILLISSSLFADEDCVETQRLGNTKGEFYLDCKDGYKSKVVVEINTNKVLELEDNRDNKEQKEEKKDEK